MKYTKSTLKKGQLYKDSTKEWIIRVPNSFRKDDSDNINCKTLSIDPGYQVYQKDGGWGELDGKFTDDITPLERAWFEECERLDKFVPKESIKLNNNSYEIY